LQITEAECDSLKSKYRKLSDSLGSLLETETALDKRSKTVSNEILAEKIALEKLKIEDAEEISALRKIEESRSGMIKDFELTEQRDTLAKYELTEIKKLHENLLETIAVMKKENENAVLPVLNKIRQEIADMTDQLTRCDELFDRETSHRAKIAQTHEELASLKKQKDVAIEEKSEMLQIAQAEPPRLEKWAETIERAAASIDSEVHNITRRVKMCEQEAEKVAERRKEVEKLRLNILEKLRLNRQTIETREIDVAGVTSNLENARAQHHDLVTSRVELNLQRKEGESTGRHRNDNFSMARKGYDAFKRQLKKKMGIANSAKQVLAPLEGQLLDQEVVLKTYEAELEEKKKAILVLKADVEANTVQFLDIDGIEKEKKLMLGQAAGDVEALEGDVLEKLGEVKRQGQLLSLLSAQRDIKSRDLSRVEKKEKEARQHVKMKELIILDLTKRCNEISNRLKEFSALYEVVKNERNKYVNLIQSSTQGLSEMREKIRILLSEVEILGNESTAKDTALTKEKKAHQHSQIQRDALRQDMNGLLSEYRSKQSVVEQQIQEIDKLNVVINTMEKEMLELKSRYEKAVEERNVTGVQLIDRNDELCVLYERSNQQQQALKAGEIQLLKRTEELRLLRLQTEELKRQYLAARKRLPEIESNNAKIQDLEAQLAEMRRKTDECSNLLEDPNNAERWRPLEGEDPTFEQLTTKIRTLEGRLNVKREQLLEKELVLEEVSALTNKMRVQAISRRDSAKEFVDQLNEFQTKIRETTKKMLASVSELSMYQATALRLQQEKAARESTLEAANWRASHGVAPTDDAVKDLDRTEKNRVLQAEATLRREERLAQLPAAGTIKTSAEPRPSAYIPDDIGIPKPYGLHAPFKPSESGSTMRHVRVPNPRQIEI